MRNLLVGVVLVALSVALSAQAQRTVSLVITNGVVVTVDAANRVIVPGAVAIDGTTIVGVDSVDAIRQRFRGTDTIDAAGAVVMLFFFQAEDGIRDLTVTGIQTCALPI